MKNSGNSDDVAQLRAELETLKRLPAAEARTMPPAYYTSGSFLDLEREEIFRKEWICLGHVVPSRLVLELADASSGDMRLSDHAARSMI